MACEDDKVQLTNGLAEATAAVQAAFASLGNLQAVAIGYKSVFCEITSRRYNPTCCSLYGNMLDAVPGDLQDRWDRAVQFATDAIAAIDCSQGDWESRVQEADSRVADCWGVLDAVNAAKAALQAAIQDAQNQGCS